MINALKTEPGLASYFTWNFSGYPEDCSMVLIARHCGGKHLSSTSHYWVESCYFADGEFIGGQGVVPDSRVHAWGYAPKAPVKQLRSHLAVSECSPSGVNRRSDT